MNTSPLSGVGKMGAIWLNTQLPRISISLLDASLPHFATVEIRNHKGRLNLLSAVIPYSKPLMIVKQGKLTAQAKSLLAKARGLMET